MAKGRNRRPAAPTRKYFSPARLNRRTVVLAGLGIAASAGFGMAVGGMLRRAATPPTPLAATSVAADTPMEEALPGTPYVAPAAPPLPLPAVPHAQPAWQRNARPFVAAGGRPAIAIVIDDLGLDHARTQRAVTLDPAVTLAFMTYAEKLPQWLAAARERHHELLVHVPMQPESAAVNPGPNALTTALSDAEILHRLRWGLDRLDGTVGANNHMGSRFTEYEPGMRVVLAELKARGLLFLDSRTTPRSACGRVAASLAVPFASRNVFLDNEATPEGVRRQLAVLEQVARRHGTAIGIGHPHDATLAALAEWLPGAQTSGLAVMPLTSAMRHAALRG